MIVILHSLYIGATALLAAVNTEIRDIGWYYLPVVLLTSVLALVVALITNNIQRRYPTFWFYPSITAEKVPPDSKKVSPDSQNKHGPVKEHERALNSRCVV